VARVYLICFYDSAPFSTPGSAFHRWSTSARRESDQRWVCFTACVYSFLLPLYSPLCRFAACLQSYPICSSCHVALGRVAPGANSLSLSINSGTAAPPLDLVCSSRKLYQSSPITRPFGGTCRRAAVVAWRRLEWCPDAETTPAP
jgi:hypothetical protein